MFYMPKLIWFTLNIGVYICNFCTFVKIENETKLYKQYNSAIPYNTIIYNTIITSVASHEILRPMITPSTRERIGHAYGINSIIPLITARTKVCST
jgi:hypothetical protein